MKRQTDDLAKGTKAKKQWTLILALGGYYTFCQ
jgi:hypothetical protein